MWWAMHSFTAWSALLNAGLLHVEEGNYIGTSVTSKVTVQLEGCPVKALPVQSGLRHLRLQSPPLSFHLSEKQLSATPAHVNANYPVQYFNCGH